MAPASGRGRVVFGAVCERRHLAALVRVSYHLSSGTLFGYLSPRRQRDYYARGVTWRIAKPLISHYAASRRQDIHFHDRAVLTEVRAETLTVGTMPANGDHVFFPALAILISATGFAGFSFTYFEPIISGSYPPAKAATG